MKLFTVVALVACVGVAVAVQDQESPAPKPGGHHEHLKQFEGTWEVSGKLWFGPGEPQEGKGEETGTLTCGGLWLVSDFKGELMGQKFHGHGVMGYDENKKKYVGTWVDSMSTGLSLSEGSCSDGGKKITMEGEMPDPMGAAHKYKQITEFKSKDEHTFTMFMEDDDGKEMKVMEFNYKRKK